MDKEYFDLNQFNNNYIGKKKSHKDFRVGVVERAVKTTSYSGS
jgi:hypothetical protein